MPDILHELTIDVPPQKVYAAITEQQGLASWWTTNTTAEPKVGSTAVFRFDHGKFAMKMKIDALEPATKVRWSSAEGMPDWTNTTVTWDLSPTEKGTKVLFGHRGFMSTEGSYAGVNYSWGYFLTSLKMYLETGKGTPSDDK